MKYDEIRNPNLMYYCIIGKKKPDFSSCGSCDRLEDALTSKLRQVRSQSNYGWLKDVGEGGLTVRGGEGKREEGLSTVGKQLRHEEPNSELQARRYEWE